MERSGHRKEMYGWIDDIKVGDEACIAMQFGAGGVLKVTRITKTQIICINKHSDKDPIRFRKEDGYRMGGSGLHGRSHLIKFTPEKRDEIMQVNLAIDMKHKDWGKIPLTKLNRIEEILKEQYNA